MCVEQEQFEVRICDVLYVPNICANLLSVGQVIEKGSHRCILWKKNV